MNDSKVNHSKTLNMILIAYQPVVNLILKTVKAQDARLHLPDLPTTTSAHSLKQEKYVNTVQTGKIIEFQTKNITTS